MNSKERMKALLTGEVPDRVGLADAPWPETRARWREEGIPANVHANDYFGMDLRVQIKIMSDFQLPEKVEESNEFQIIEDSDGNVSKVWKNKTGVPLHLKYGLADAEAWARLKPRLVANDNRFAFGYYGDYQFEYTSGHVDKVKAAYDGYGPKDSTCVSLALNDPYEFAMWKMGDENILVTMAMEPELLKDIFETYVGFVRDCGDLLFSKGFKPDVCFLGGDIAYKNGLLFSPAMYRELVFPYLKRIIDYFKGERGLPIIYHSDGNPTEALPLLVEAGIDCLQPLEVNAGMDVRAIAKEWGDRIAFMGNISTQTMAGAKDALVADVRSRIDACRRAGARYIVHSDHSVPPMVPLENMRAVVEVVNEYGDY